MGGTKIMVDSTAGFPKEWYEKHGLGVVQLSVFFPQNSQKSPEFTGVIKDFDLAPEKFYAYLENLNKKDKAPSTSAPNWNTSAPEKFYAYLENLNKKDKVPSTSAPNWNTVADAFDAEFKAGAENIILFDLMGSKSTTYNSALAAKGNHPKGDRIEVVDSLSVGPGIGYMALDAKKYAESNNFTESAKYANSLKGNSTIFAVPKTLYFLHKGGRISNMEAILGSILHISPVISIVKAKDKQGKEIYDLQSVDRTRSVGHAISSIDRRIGELAKDYYSRGLRIVDYGICNTGDVAGAKELDEVVFQAIKNNGLKVGYRDIENLPIVLTTHLGPGAFGIGLYARKN
jgi:DegV family protein with EDD domain